jgi:hypothetical protein
MRHASRSFKLRCGQLALCLTLAAGAFAVVNVSSAGASTTCSVTGTGGTCPLVAHVTPNHSPVTGGTSITITGSNFQPGAKVVIGQGTRTGQGALALTNVLVVSSNEIIGNTAGGALPGFWGLWVINPDGGVNGGSIFTLFAYDPLPVVEGMTPNSGPVAGGTAVTIKGTGFQTGAIVEVAQGTGLGGAVPMTNVVVVSPSEITGVTGASARAGTFATFVLNPDGGVSTPSVASLFAYS